jgi:hypothetical protein
MFKKNSARADSDVDFASVWLAESACVRLLCSCVGPIIIYSRGNAQKEKERKKEWGASAFILASIYLLQHDRNVSGCTHLSLSHPLFSSFRSVVVM